MFVTKLKIHAVVWLASCVLAGLTPLSCAPAQDSVGDSGAASVASNHRLFKPGRTLAYVNVYSIDRKVDEQDIRKCAGNLSSDLDVGIIRNLGHPISVIRVRLDPDGMRANHLSFKDMERGFVSSMLWPRDWRQAVIGKAFRLNEKQHELLVISRIQGPPEQFGNLILKANSKGEILRLKDVGRVELAYRLFDISSDVDRHPAATLDIKGYFDSDAAADIKQLQKELNKFKKESLPPGMELDLIPFENQSMLYAVLETPQGSTRKFTSAKCHELGAIAKGIAEVASVTSLVGYQLRTESGAPNVATWLIHLKNRTSSQRTPRQIIETLEEKCRAMNARVEFFEPPAFSAFVTISGFSVRVLDKANLHSDQRLGKKSQTSMEDLLNRQDFADLFAFLARDYWQYELVIDDDVAAHEGVSIADALEHLAKVVAGDGASEQKFDVLVEQLAHSSVKNDHGETVAYRSFMQLKNKLRPNATDR